MGVGKALSRSVQENLERGTLVGRRSTQAPTRERRIEPVMRGRDKRAVQNHHRRFLKFVWSCLCGAIKVEQRFLKGLDENVHSVARLERAAQIVHVRDDPLSLGIREITRSFSELSSRVVVVANLAMRI